ncbi:MAG: SDR family NAD(P)-dependent oxidoreductase [Gemmatimonadota bacterium]
MISLAGKRALVTGGSRGIGGATSFLLARCGARVAIHYKSRRQDAEELLSSMSEIGGGHLAIAAEIGDREQVNAMFEAVRQSFGGLDIVVANAGIWPVEDVGIAAMADERWDRTMRENVDALLYVTRAALRVMDDGGRIVLVSSTAGQRGESGHADYAASKGAMISFVKSVAVETAGRGITVNSVAPGWVDTEMCADVFAAGGRERIAATIPLGRIATPADIAAPIVFLCSGEARHITGEVLNVNGGSVMCG